MTVHSVTKRSRIALLEILCSGCDHPLWVHRMDGTPIAADLLDEDATCPNCYDCSSDLAEDDDATA